jgi:tripartite-type tricarboxylate transporter receptor subunit TctC
MQRLIALPPGVPQAAVDALRTAIAELNDDKADQEEAVRTIGYVPEWISGPQTNERVRKGLSAPPETRAFLNDYIQQRKK